MVLISWTKSVEQHVLVLVDQELVVGADRRDQTGVRVGAQPRQNVLADVAAGRVQPDSG